MNNSNLHKQSDMYSITLANSIGEVLATYRIQFPSKVFTEALSNDPGDDWPIMPDALGTVILEEIANNRLNSEDFDQLIESQKVVNKEVTA